MREGGTGREGMEWKEDRKNSEIEDNNSGWKQES